tara:strand:- start:152 stop:529 length:378 start_codon:yes stop_codon:yes gene_type:complete
MHNTSSNRSFGLIFFAVFLLIGIWPLKDGELIRVWSVILCSIFLILGLLNSKLLSPLNLAWIKFGEYLGRVIAPIVMAIVYFLVVTPIGLFMRMIGKDFLRLKFSKENTYWIKREKNINSMKKQF